MTLSSLYILLGKLHPVAVHLPIGLIIYVAIFELYYFLKRNRDYSLERSVYPYTLGALFSVVAAVFGWINADTQDFNGELGEILETHRLGGLVVAGLLLGISFLGLKALKQKGAFSFLYRALAIVSAGGIGFVAHFGGLLVHGTDYYDEVFLGGSHNGADSSAQDIVAQKTIPPAALRKVTFDEDIHPILKGSCYKCHGEGKRKGDYSIDSRDDLIKGGKSLKVAIEVGKSEESHLIELVSGIIPKKIMPSKGKRLTNDQIGILRAWIDQGAPWSSNVHQVAHRIAKVGTEPRRPELPESNLVNPIDKIAAAYFKKQEISPPSIVDDRTFVRRVYLDVLGVIPSAEDLTKFLNDTSHNKREMLVDKILGYNYRYAAHWMTFWNDALRNDYSGPGFLLGNRKEITPWLFEALLKNMPYDEFVSLLINPTPETVGFVRGIKWWKSGVVNANEEPSMQAAQNIAQVFMGVNLKCASCHSSFTDEWSLTDAYGFANAIGGKALGTNECNIPTGETVAPRFLYPELGEIKSRGRVKRRGELAALVTSDENGRFARTIVNRIWERLFGVGLVEPIDELDNPAWNQDMLDWLSSELVSQKYDLKKILRIILTSQTYQLPSVPAKETFEKEYVFRGPTVRRLTVEQLLDSVSLATEVVPPAKPGDIERIMSVTLASSNLSESSPSISREPRILYQSGTVSSEDGTVDIEANIDGASSIWMVVLRSYKKANKLDAQRAQFDLVAKQDSGALDVLDQSLQARRDSKDHNRKFKFKPGRVPSYEAQWINPILLNGKGQEISLVNQSNIVRDVYIDEEGADDDKEIGQMEDRLTEVSFDNNIIHTRAFSAVSYNVEGMGLKKLKAKARLVPKDPRAKGIRVQYWIVSDLPVRSVFLEASPLTLAMGRPRREQITTRRARFTSTMQGLELLSGEEFDDLLSRSANSLRLESLADPKLIAEKLYVSLLGRSPNEDEISLAVKVIDGSYENGSSVEDLLWSLVLLPEFQLIT